MGQGRFLITGATGFVGGWLVDELRSHRPDVALFGTSHSAPKGGGTDIPGVTLLPCDITKPESVRSVVETADPTHVIHLAGIASATGGDADTLRAVNADAATTLLEAVAALGGDRRVVLASSGYVYGATNHGKPAVETDPIHAIGAYAESKVAMEDACNLFLRREKAIGLSVVLARAFNHTGARQTDAFVVPAFAKQIAQIERGELPPVVKVGNLDALRDFLHVADVVQAYRLLCETDLPDPVTVVNVASGVGVSIRAMLDELIALSGANVSVQTDPARLRPSDLPECIGDNGKLKRLTGWTPEHSLTQTLQETLDYWRGQTDN